MLLLQVIDGGQFVELVALVATVETVADGVGAAQVFGGQRRSALKHGGLTALLKTDKVVGVDGVRIGVLEAVHGLLETVELTHVMVDGRHHLGAVHGLAPLGALHLRICGAGFRQELCADGGIGGMLCRLSSIGNGEEGQRLATGKINKLTHIEALLDADEMIQMVAQFADALQHRLADGHHLGKAFVV